MKCYSSSLFKRYGFKKNYNSIGTFLTLISLKRRHKFSLIKIDIKKDMEFQDTVLVGSQN